MYRRRQLSEKLSIVSETDFHTIFPARNQCAVIETAAITKAVTGQVERYARYDDKGQFLDWHQLISTRFHHTKGSGDQIGQTRDFYKLKVIILDSRINQGLADLNSMPGHGISQHLIVNGAVQSQAFCTAKQVRPQKTLLDLDACAEATFN
jgi:hypothetical protein